MIETFLEVVNDSYLYQHVCDPTRIREGNIPSVLDLIFTNEENMVETVKYMPPLGKSDHLLLSFNFNCYTADHSEKSRRYMYHKGDYEKLNDLLRNAEWSSHENDSVASMWEFFKESIQTTVDECIPMSNSGKSKKKKDWLTYDERLTKRKRLGKNIVTVKIKPTTQIMQKREI